MKQKTEFNMKPIAALSALAFLAILAAPAIAQDQQPDHQRPTFAELDSNADGQVTTEEIAAAATARFTATDINADGQLSFDELKAAGMVKAESMVEQMARMHIARQDVDNSGALSAEEASNDDRMAKMIDHLDTDNDGKISAAEFEAMKDGRGKHGRDHGQGDGQGRGWFHRN
jgi:Ca2+-binding EF-hand superfamily protein